MSCFISHTSHRSVKIVWLSWQRFQLQLAPPALCARAEPLAPPCPTHPPQTGGIPLWVNLIPTCFTFFQFLPSLHFRHHHPQYSSASVCLDGKYVPSRKGWLPVAAASSRNTHTDLSRCVLGTKLVCVELLDEWVGVSPTCSTITVGVRWHCVTFLLVAGLIIIR